MANNEKQIGVRVTESLWEQFREDVKQRHGRVNGHLASEVEAALREYMDASHGGDVNDRLARIENQIGNLAESVGENGTKKEQSEVGSTVEQRLDDVIETVESEADGAPRVHDSVIEMAIKSHAGMSDPTIRQYRKLLQERKIAFEDPRSGSSYYYLDAPLYCNAVNEMLQDGEIDKDTYLGVIEGTYNRDWWGTQIQEFEKEFNNDRTPGFQ